MEHPAPTTAFQRYRQACLLLRTTSRAFLPSWYQNALELDFQLHIRTDGATVHTFFFDKARNEWSAGLPLTEDVMVDRDKSVTFAAQLLSHIRTLKGTSVGIILHITEEFATAELDPELDNPAALPDLREAAVTNPAEVLDDSSVSLDQSSWRVIPYPAAGSEVIGTTIRLSKRMRDFLVVVREFGEERNFPMITHALSAPLVAILGLPSAITATDGKPFVAILQYPWFTALAFFNEHSDLRLIRALQHRGLRRPSNFRQALATTNASLEFVDPHLFVIPLGRDVDPRLADDLTESCPDSPVSLVGFPTVDGIPECMLEPALSVEVIPEEKMHESHTFGVLRKERWFLQDFLPAAKATIDAYPTSNEMRLLRYLKLGRIAVAALAVVGIGWMALSAITVVRRPEWKFNKGESQAVKQRLISLTQERQRVDHWNNLLDDRSKAWSSMEAVARLFPAKSGLLLKSFVHTVRPDNAPGQAKVGFVKEWNITGLARDNALEYLNTMNSREGIFAHFSEISEATGNTAYDPTPNTRTLSVNVKTQENSSFKQMPLEHIVDSDESTYPFRFSLSITQRFESTDPLAINATTAP